MYEDIKKEFTQLEEELSKSENQKDQEKLIKLSQKHSSLKKVIDLIDELQKNISHLEQNKEIKKTKMTQNLKKWRKWR